MMRIGFGIDIVTPRTWSASGTYIDSVILRPNGLGDTANMETFGSGSSNWGRCSDESDATGVVIWGWDSGQGKDRYAMENLPGDSISVSQVDVRLRAKLSNSGQATTLGYGMKLGAEISEPTEKSITTTSWVDWHADWNSAPKPGGGDWTVADVNAILFGPKSVLVGFDVDLEFAEVWLRVDVERPL